jgi:hypothetical protein
MGAVRKRLGTPTKGFGAVGEGTASFLNPIEAEFFLRRRKTLLPFELWDCPSVCLTGHRSNSTNCLLGSATVFLLLDPGWASQRKRLTDLFPAATQTVVCGRLGEF